MNVYYLFNVEREALSDFNESSAQALKLLHEKIYIIQ